MSIREVRPDDGSPSCHVCGAIMVPASKGFKCFSCGAATEPTGPAPSVVESRPQELEPTSPEPRAAVHACDFEAEAERLHIAICQAVTMLNNGDTLKGHTILREALAAESRVTAEDTEDVQ